MDTERRSNLTIKDLARELNISPSTVSRALANSELVKADTRKAVQELAKKYNYQPNFTALSLRINKTKTIGVIIPQIVHDFFSLVLRGIEDFSYSMGYNVIICSSHEIYEREVSDAQTLLAGKVDGLLVCVSKETVKYDHLNEFLERDIPLVLFDRAPDSIKASKVAINDFEAAINATSHLIEQGCTRIAYVGGPEKLSIYQNRYRGFRKALEINGITPDKGMIVHCESEDYDECFHTTKKLNGKSFDGLFAATDMMAIASIKNLKQAGRKIPEEVAVVGFSNWSISSIYEPSISTINQPGYDMGSLAAEILFDQIQNGNGTIRKEILETELIVRDSSKRS